MRHPNMGLSSRAPTGARPAWSAGLQTGRPRTGHAPRGAQQIQRGLAMPQGDKSAYTDKQRRQAEHVEESERERGRSEEDAERIGWATVNKQDGGAKRSGLGRKRPEIRRKRKAGGS
jgi:hypothetical protein